MLRVNKLADYGALIMVYLAQSEAVIMNARDIASRTRLSVATVSKILKLLAAQDLLIATRGARGGYRLKRPACEITLAEILSAFNRPQGLTACSVHDETCALQSFCLIQDNWRLVSQTIENAFRMITLEAFAQPMRSSPALLQMQQVLRGVNRVQST